MSIPKKIKKGSISSPASIVLINPKFPRNVGGAVRSASCFNADNVLFTGKRVSLDPENYDNYRLPREERMKGYSEVTLANVEKFTPLFEKDVVPIAVEKRESSTDLVYFQHPKKAVYVFGPEDGSLDKPILNLCHEFIWIPSKFCVNLAAAVNLVLYDRLAKQESHTDYRFEGGLQ